MRVEGTDLLEFLVDTVPWKPIWNPAKEKLGNLDLIQLKFVQLTLSFVNHVIVSISDELASARTIKCVLQFVLLQNCWSKQYWCWRTFSAWRWGKIGFGFLSFQVFFGCLQELSHVELFWPRSKLPLSWRKSENTSLLREKNTNEIIIIHKGTRMAKDGEDWHGLKTTNLKNFSRCANREVTVSQECSH